MGLRHSGADVLRWLSFSSDQPSSSYPVRVLARVWELTEGKFKYLFLIDLSRSIWEDAVARGLSDRAYLEIPSRSFDSESMEAHGPFDRACLGNRFGQFARGGVVLSRLIGLTCGLPVQASRVELVSMWHIPIRRAIDVVVLGGPFPLIYKVTPFFLVFFQPCPLLFYK